MKILCLNPLVAIVDDVFDQTLADQAIAMGKDRLERAAVVNRDSEGSNISDNRTNYDAALDQWANPKLTDLAQKISNFVRLPPENTETAKLLHYSAEQEFKPHCDGFGRSVSELRKLSHGGQRLFTTICYLNDVENGGETEFPALKISIKPKLGRVLIFGNTFPGTAEPHPQSTHAGRPVVDGEKWAITFWWRQLTYMVHREFPNEEGETKQY
jgi:prolyl 4-hydroxylase